MKREILLLLLLVLVSTRHYAQEQPDIRSRAYQYFTLGEYARAATLYEKLVDKKKVRTQDLEHIAACYQQINAYEQAENWYARAMQQEGYLPETHWNYAQALKQNGKYDAAKKQFEAYRTKYGASDQLALEIAGADSAVRWIAAPQKIDIRNERSINTPLSQFAAYPWKGNQVLYATEPMDNNMKVSGMTGNAFLRLASANTTAETLALQADNLLSGAVNNAAYHIGPVASTASGEVLYVTRTYPGKDVERFRKDGLKFKKHNLELMIYTKDGDDWTVEPFAYNDVKKYSVGHASLSSDGRVLYFASDMPGGIGGVDIWCSFLENDGKWGTPQNLGSAVNSVGDELFPTIHGDKLYYSSNGFAGMGGLDVYVATGKGNQFVGRQNLKYPINTASDDFSFVVIKSKGTTRSGYLSSNRLGGAGGDDIYSFNDVPTPVNIRLVGTTVNKNTNALLPEAAVYLFDKDNTLVSRKLSDDRGAFAFDISADKSYSIRAEKTGFHEDMVLVDAVHPIKDTTLSVVLRLQPVSKPGDKFVLENIYYDFDKYNIRKDASIILNGLVRTLRDNPTLRIELSSHTDSRGSDRYNESLSQKRAQSAVDYLVSQGIDRNRLKAKGYGEKRLVNHCSNGVSCSAAEHQANRRTEIEILEY